MRSRIWLGNTADQVSINPENRRASGQEKVRIQKAKPANNQTRIKEPASSRDVGTSVAKIKMRRRQNRVREPINNHSVAAMQTLNSDQAKRVASQASSQASSNFSRKARSSKIEASRQVRISNGRLNSRRGQHAILCSWLNAA